MDRWTKSDIVLIPTTRGVFRALRWSGAIALTLVVLALAFVFLFVGIGLYLDDYCLGADLGMNEDPLATGARFESPVTLSCSYEVSGSVSQVDLFPLLYILVVLGAAVGALVMSWYMLVMRGRSRPD